MILDPRLVPWSDVVPGVGVALVVAAAGFFLWRWRTAALVLLAAAPVAGLAVAMWNLRGSLPSIPPVDATLWVFYFAVGGVILAAVALPLSHRRWWVNVATILSIAFIAAIWATLLRSIAVPDESGTSMRTPVLFLAWLAFLMSIDMRKGLLGLSAEYAPWVTGLVTASVCLALTGTASVSTLALVLALCAIPAAIVILVRAGRTSIGSVVAEPKVDPESQTVATPAVEKVRSPQLQAVTLPLAASLPLLILSGSLFASTPWMTSLLVMLSPIAGLTALRIFTFFVNRSKQSDRAAAGNWKTELLAIGIALTAAAIPAAIAAYQVIEAAAAEDPFY